MIREELTATNIPDFHKIVETIAQSLKEGMAVSLNLDTAEINSVETKPSESTDASASTELSAATDISADGESVSSAVADNVVTILPFDADEIYGSMKDFVEECVDSKHEDYDRLLDALCDVDPVKTFNSVVNASEEYAQKWTEFMDKRFRILVLEELLENVVGDAVKPYEMNDDTRELIALATASGRYCYYNPINRTVIISAVKAREPEEIIDERGEKSYITHYSLRECIQRMAEERSIATSGVGVVFEPHDFGEEGLTERVLQRSQARIESALATFDKMHDKIEKICREIIEKNLDKDSEGTNMELPFDIDDLPDLIRGALKDVSDPSTDPRDDSDFDPDEDDDDFDDDDPEDDDDDLDEDF